CLDGLTIPWTAVFNTSYDDTVFTIAANEGLPTGGTGQDTGHLLINFDSKTNGCTVYNTGDSVITFGSKTLPAHTIIKPNGTQIQPHFINSFYSMEVFSLHEAFPFGNGVWAEVSGMHCKQAGTGADCPTNPTESPWFWNTQTGDMVTATF